MDMQPEKLIEIFRRNVKQRRIELGISQSALADRLGVDQGYISDIERGTRNPSLIRLAPLAEALDTTPSALISAVSMAHS
jgi:transcriptional regulator with XRE-family HTH domain